MHYQDMFSFRFCFRDEVHWHCTEQMGKEKNTSQKAKKFLTQPFKTKPKSWGMLAEEQPAAAPLDGNTQREHSLPCSDTALLTLSPFSVSNQYGSSAWNTQTYLTVCFSHLKSWLYLISLHSKPTVLLARPWGSLSALRGLKEQGRLLLGAGNCARVGAGTQQTTGEGCRVPTHHALLQG